MQRNLPARPARPARPKRPSRPKRKSHLVSVRLDPHVYEALQVQAALEGVTVSELLRVTIEKKLRRNGAKLNTYRKQKGRTD